MKKNGRPPKPCTDHKGNKFSSVSEMCRTYGMTEYVYYQRICNGWPQERALTEPIRGKSYEHRDDTELRKFETINRLLRLGKK